MWTVNLKFQMPGLSLSTVSLVWYCFHSSYRWGLLCILWHLEHSWSSQISLDQLQARLKEHNRSWLSYPVSSNLSTNICLTFWREDNDKTSRTSFKTSALVIIVCWLIPWLGLSDNDNISKMLISHSIIDCEVLCWYLLLSHWHGSCCCLRTDTDWLSELISPDTN